MLTCKHTGRSTVEVDRYGFFSGRCRYLEIRAADVRYVMLIFFGPICLDDFLFLFLPSSRKIKVK